MARPVIGITHRTEQVPRHFADQDLERLAAVAELRILGSNRFDEIAEQLGDVRILMGSWGMPRLDEELLVAAPALEAVCYAAGSVKGFVTPASWARGIVITTAMHANAIPVAEVSVALITLANKGWFACQDRIRAAGHAAFPTIRETPHPGNFGTTVGLIGFGAIGREVAQRLQGMDLQVLVYDPFADAALCRRAGVERVLDLQELAGRSMVVSLHAPNVPETAGMIDAAFLAAMPDGATFINTARGALVDEAALVAELQRGRIAAMLDVTKPEPPEPGHPFYSLPNCWLTPHRAGSSAGEIRRMGQFAIDDALRILAGEAPRYPVAEDMLATMA